MTIEEIVNELSTQDNRCTSEPVFIVQQKRRLYGLDMQWGGDVAWLYEGEEEKDPTELNRLNKAYEDTGKEPDDYTRTGYQDIWGNK